MYDLTAFSLSDLIRLTAALRRVEGGSLEEVAGGIVRHLYANLTGGPTRERASVLVRFYVTQRFGDLDAELQEFVLERAGRADVGADIRCLTLLATVGDEPEWNDRRLSSGHRAIPLLSEASVRRSPMVHALLAQLGVDVAQVVEPSDELWLEPGAQSYNVFHVAEAAGSALVPAQTDFVVPHGVRSVVGFGGLMPGSEVWAVIAFSRTPIDRDAAEHFRSVALTVAANVLPRAGNVFTGRPARAIGADELAVWQIGALHQLLEERERDVLGQTMRLEQVLADLEERAAELGRSREVLARSEARKGAIINASLDAVVSIDGDGLLTEFNPAAEAVFGFRREEVLGQPMVDLLVPVALRDRHRAGFAHHLRTGEARLLNTRIEITALRRSGEEFPIELTVTRAAPLDGTAFTAFIRDLTAEKRTESELRELAMTLQASLLPPTEVVIPGLDVATLYRPAASELLVGGDFFDVFGLSDGDWGIVMGDVCGKGARAAALTAVARYTLRAAGVHHSSPADALEETNSAIVAETADDERFCTAVFARITAQPGTARVVVSTAGHPQAVLLRRDGGAEFVGTTAFPLGLFDHAGTADAHAELRPGDALILYTDGLVEARDGDGDLLGYERLLRVVRPLAGADAKAIRDGIVEALLAHSPSPSDDTAIAVVRLPDGPD